MQCSLRFPSFGTKHREFQHTEVCLCMNDARRCQHLKQCPDYPSLCASSRHSERNNDNSWLLAANLQTVEGKPTVQEIRSFISDPRYRIDIWYSKCSLGCMKVFQKLRNDGYWCGLRKSLQTTHTGLNSNRLIHHFKRLQVPRISAENVSR